MKDKISVSGGEASDSGEAKALCSTQTNLSPRLPVLESPLIDCIHNWLNAMYRCTEQEKLHVLSQKLGIHLFGGEKMGENIISCVLVPFQTSD